MIQDNDYKSFWKRKKGATVATSLTKVKNSLDETGYTYLDSYHTYSSDSDKKPEARKEPIKDTQTIKEKIKGPHLVNTVRYLMDGPTNMNPLLTGVGIIGQEGPQTISGGSHTQNIFQGGKSIICSDVITHVLTNSSEVTLESDSFTFDSLKAKKLMVVPLIEPSLTIDGDVRSTSVIRASGPDHSRIVVPGMNKDILSRDDV